MQTAKQWSSIYEEKKRFKIKNLTRANLIQEFPGLFESCDERSFNKEMCA